MRIRQHGERPKRPAVRHAVVRRFQHSPDRLQCTPWCGGHVGDGNMPPATAHRAHADDLEIEAAAKRRLTDEYDAVQARGEVTRLGTNQSDLGVSDGNTRLSTAVNIRLSRKAIHDARLTRDAEVAAKRRHTDEYDAAQARGEIAGHGWSKVEPANLTNERRTRLVPLPGP